MEIAPLPVKHSSPQKKERKKITKKVSFFFGSNQWNSYLCIVIDNTSKIRL